MKERRGRRIALNLHEFAVHAVALDWRSPLSFCTLYHWSFSVYATCRLSTSCCLPSPYSCPRCFILPLLLPPFSFLPSFLPFPSFFPPMLPTRFRQILRGLSLFCLHANGSPTSPLSNLHMIILLPPRRRIEPENRIFLTGGKEKTPAAKTRTTTGTTTRTTRWKR